MSSSLYDQEDGDDDVVNRAAREIHLLPQSLARVIHNVTSSNCRLIFPLWMQVCHAYLSYQLES
jgi:hypothetical protein